MRKISHFLFVSIVLTVFFITFFITFSIENAVIKVLDQSIRDNMASSSQKYAVEFNHELETVENQANQIAEIVSASFDMSAFKKDDAYLEKFKGLMDPIIERVAKKGTVSKSTYLFFVPELDNKAHDIWYADLDKNGIVEKQDPFPMSYYDGDMKWKQWFYIPVQTKKPYWTEPYIGTVDADRDIVYVSYTIPVIVDGKVIAVAGSDYYLTQMQDKIKSYKFKQTGYASLINRNDEILVHPVLAEGVNLKDLENGGYRPLVKQLRSKSNGFLEYTWLDNQKKIMYFNRLRNDWVIMMTLEKTDFLSDLKGLNLVRGIIYLIGLSITLFVSYLISRRITKPIEDCNFVIDQMKNGSFDHQVLKTYELRRDEIGDLTRLVEPLRTKIQETMADYASREALLETEVAERLDELLRTNAYLELTLAQLQEQHSELLISEERMSTANSRVKEIEKKLIETEKRAAMTYLINGLSQDLNSPIGSSMTLISFLNSEALEIQKRHQQKNLDRETFEEFMKSTVESYGLLVKSLNTASELVSQFKKMGTDRTKEFNTTFRMNEFIGMIFTSMKAYHPHHQINLVILSKEWLIAGNQGAFSQLLTILIENTILHGYREFEKGLIQIQIDKIDENSMIMTYEDYGCGVDKHILDLMFVPYYSINGARETGGIGLNIVYHLVTKVFGGSITADLNVESGVKYYIILRVAIPEQIGLL